MDHKLSGTIRLLKTIAFRLITALRESQRERERETEESAAMMRTRPTSAPAATISLCMKRIGLLYAILFFILTFIQQRSAFYCELKNAERSSLRSHLSTLPHTTDEVEKAKAEAKRAKAEARRARNEAEEAKIEAERAKDEAKRANAEVKKVKAKKKKNQNIMNCEGFPDWPLSPAVALYDDNVGEPRCYPDNASNPWILHQTSAPNRRPSISEVKVTLSNLPVGTGYTWHSDNEICAFMRTQPLRFQALFNALRRTPHKTDLWRYLLLYQKGGIYLDDDAKLLVRFNSSFVDSVDSVYATQGNSFKAMGVDRVDDIEKTRRAFGFTVFNGLLISKPCNRVLLSVAERMVQIGPIEESWAESVDHPDLMNWYNLKLLAMAIAERSPKDLVADINCVAGPTNCTLFERNTNRLLPFNNKRSVVVYKDDHKWKTAVFDTAQCGMPVEQVSGGKHDAVSVDPHPSPWLSTVIL